MTWESQRRARRAAEQSAKRWQIIAGVLALVLGFVAIVAYNQHEEAQRNAYAINNNCVWQVRGSHDLCIKH